MSKKSICLIGKFFESLLNNNSWKRGKLGGAIKQVAPTELLEKFDLY